MVGNSSIEPSYKRKRIDPQNEDTHTPTSTSNSPTFERPTEFWIDDGNVVLQVDKTQFRVHRSMLRSHSSFFFDMFGLPQPADAPTVEGCPLVHCSGDAVQDWKNVLGAIYLPLRPFLVTCMISMLRLGKKYQLNLIRDTAVRNMKSRIPSTGMLKSWDVLMTPLHGRHMSVCDHIFDLINIALEVGLQSVLPALYYACAVNVPVDRIFEGLPRADGTVSRLSSDSQRIIVVGQSKMRSFIPSHAIAWLSAAPAYGCFSPHNCPLQRMNLLNLVVPSLFLDLRYALDEYGCIARKSSNFCASCLRHAEEMHQESRLKIWKELPLLFGLPKWEDIVDSVD